jgi:hypothetical protein
MLNPTTDDQKKRIERFLKETPLNINMITNLEDLDKYLLTAEMSMPPNKIDPNTNDTIYLCLYTKPLDTLFASNSMTRYKIGAYECKLCQTVEDAENYYSALKKDSSNTKHGDLRCDARNGIIVNIPVFIPQMFHRIFIEKHLCNLLVNVKMESYPND